MIGKQWEALCGEPWESRKGLGGITEDDGFFKIVKRNLSEKKRTEWAALKLHKGSKSAFYL